MWSILSPNLLNYYYCLPPITILSHWHPLVLIFLVPNSILLSSPDCLLRNLYAGQEATVRPGHGTADWFQIGRGIYQGCILSPCLLNSYAEYIMRNAGLEEAQGGIKIGGRNIVIKIILFNSFEHTHYEIQASSESETSVNCFWRNGKCRLYLESIVN